MMSTRRRVMAYLGVSLVLMGAAAYMLRTKATDNDLLGDAVGPLIIEKPAWLVGAPSMARDGRVYFLLDDRGMNDTSMSLASVSESSPDILRIDYGGWPNKCDEFYSLEAIRSRSEGGFSVSGYCQGTRLEEIGVLDPRGRRVDRQGEFKDVASIGNLGDGTEIAIVKRTDQSCQTLVRRSAVEWKDLLPAGENLASQLSSPTSAKCFSDNASIVGSDGVAIVYVLDASELTIRDLSGSNTKTLTLPFRDIEGADVAAGALVVSGKLDGREGLWSFDLQSQKAKLLGHGKFGAPSWMVPGETLLVGQYLSDGIQIRKLML